MGSGFIKQSFSGLGGYVGNVRRSTLSLSVHVCIKWNMQIGFGGVSNKLGCRTV